MPKRCVLSFLVIFMLAALWLPNSVLAASAKPSAEAVTIPAGATPEQVRDIMADLTDEQVRSLLIKELKRESEKQAASENKPHGLAALLHEVHGGMDLLRHRFEYLFSGAVTAPRELPKTLRSVLGGTMIPPGRLILAVAVLTALWAGVMALFRRRTVAARKAISRLPGNAYWFERMGRLFLRALLDLFGVVLGAVVVLACYLGLFNEGAAAKPVVIAWLAAMVFLALVKIAARFLLAPHAPSLRYLPLSDRVAQYLFRWTVWLGRIMATGLLLTALIRLAGGSEALFLLTSALFGSLIAFVLVLMILWNKKPVADFLRANQPEDSFLYGVADVWQVGGIAYVLGFWMFWLLALVVFGTRAMLPGLVTLLVVPVYFLLDWATQRLVAFAVALAAESAGPEEEGEEPRGITRFQAFLSKGFRVLILAATGFSLLRVWGLDISLGRTTVRAFLTILVTLVLAYIFWIFLSSIIERKLMAKQGDDGHGDGEAGGPGGDRFSTLLQLIRKFIFAAISVITIAHRPVVAGRGHRPAHRRGVGPGHRHRLRRPDPGQGHHLRHLLPHGRRLPRGRLHRDRQRHGHGGGDRGALHQASASPRLSLHHPVRLHAPGQEQHPRLGGHEAPVPGAVRHGHPEGQEDHQEDQQGDPRRARAERVHARRHQKPGRQGHGGVRHAHAGQVHDQARRPVHPAQAGPGQNAQGVRRRRASNSPSRASPCTCPRTPTSRPRSRP